MYVRPDATHVHLPNLLDRRPRQKRSGCRKDPEQERSKRRARTTRRRKHRMSSSTQLCTKTTLMSPQVSLFVSNLPDEADEAAVRSTFSSYVQPSQIKNVVYVSASKVAFVNFVDRQAAEEAARQCALECAVADQPVKVSWGRSRPKKTSTVS